MREFVTPVVRRFTSPHAATPRTHLLSNGRYAVMLTAAGSGYSRWQDVAITRWREDGTRDIGGTYVFLREVAAGESWSAGYQPRGAEPDSYEVVFSRAGRTSLVATGRSGPRSRSSCRRRTMPRSDGYRSRTSGRGTRDVEVTSYAEIVLASPAADAAHPAFSNLFVDTEALADKDAVLATRRPRAAGERQLWLAHVVVVEGETVGEVQWETDRARFLGRGRGNRAPMAQVDGRPCPARWARCWTRW